MADVVELVSPAIVTVRHYEFGSQKASVGSGVLIDNKGSIITNAHVVSLNMNFITTIEMNDETKHAARILYFDKCKDLALLKIEAKTEKCFFGSTLNCRRGDTVVTLGSPLGLTQSVTKGIISAFRNSRQIGLGGIEANMVQTDAIIAKGSSGGALLDLNGRLIGINSHCCQEFHFPYVWKTWWNL